MNAWLIFAGCFALGYVLADHGNRYPILKGFGLFAVVTGVALFLSGCTTQIAPNLKLPEAKACPALAMPPLPMECVIDIRGDVMTASSQDCENVIRYYVKARQLLRKSHGG